MTKPPATYALVGNDSFLQLAKLQEILGALPHDAQRVDVDGEVAEIGDVLDELRSFAMFGAAKVVVVRNGDDFISRFREQLEEYVQSPSDSGVLILRVNSLPGNQRLGKLIIKHGRVAPCEPPAARALPGWIMERAKSVHKLTIAPKAAELLAERIGADLGRLDMELSKLALLVDSGKVDESLVAQSVVFQRDQEMYDMTNELAMGNPRQALDRWRKLLELEPSAEFRGFTWLTMWLEDVANVFRGNTGKMVWKYRDRLDQFIKTAQTMGPEKHRRAVKLLAELDRRSKSGLGDAAGNVERFILALAE